MKYLKDKTVINVEFQGVKVATVLLRDKLNGNYLQTKEVTRATLAKWYHEQKITHTYNGLPVVEI